VVEGDTPFTAILLVVEMVTPCMATMAMLLAAEMDTQCMSLLLAVEMVTPCIAYCDGGGNG
jgi:hypothetical protein